MLGLHKLFNKLTGRHNKKDPKGNTALYRAVKEGNLSTVKRLLKGGADPNIRNAHLLTPLHQAAYWGETEIVELLLQYGAKVTIDNGKGWTALHSAAIGGGLKTRGDVIDLLLKAKADIMKPDKSGWTPHDYMMLWETSATAAEKLKKYTALMEGLRPSSPQPPPKPSTSLKPKH